MTASSFRPITQPKSHRLCITIPDTVFQRLNSASFEQGRSLSNLAAFLLEVGLLSLPHNSA